MTSNPVLSSPSEPTNSARHSVAAFWNDYVTQWLTGEDPHPDPTSRWFASYQGRGTGTATRDGLVEPYTGDLLGQSTTPRVVVLGLNPGHYYPTFQARDGIFAREIREHGSYSRWAATGPYLRPPWTTAIGPNRYQRARLAFARNWLDEPGATHADLLVFEMYPWHSTTLTAGLRAPADIIDRFVWQPIAELPTTHVFAFGRPWYDLANNLGLPLTDGLGHGGRPYGSTVPNRAVRVYALPSGQHLVMEWHTGSATPPRATEVALLKTALTEAT